MSVSDSNHNRVVCSVLKRVDLPGGALWGRRVMFGCEIKRQPLRFVQEGQKVITELEILTLLSRVEEGRATSGWLQSYISVSREGIDYHLSEMHRWQWVRKHLDTGTLPSYSLTGRGRMILLADESAPYALRIENKRDYLQVRVSGLLTLQSEYSTDRDIASACSEHGKLNVLVDVRQLNGELTEREVIQAASTLPERGLGEKLRLALVDIPGYDSLNALYAAVAAECGTTVKMFTDVKAASTWLANPVRRVRC